MDHFHAAAISLDGFLVFIIVDSRGIDAGAPWPKHQHDLWITGNTATDLQQFSCE